MSAISSVSGSTDQQWQLLQQLRASRAAETAAKNGSTAVTGSTTGASATAGSAVSSSGVSQFGMSQSGTGATATASAPSGLFDTVATKLMSGMQSFLVNMQSDAGSAASGGSVSGYGKSAEGAAGSSLMSGLTA